MPAIPCPPLPLDTAQAAEAVFGSDHPYLKIGQSLTAIWGRLEFPLLDSVEPFLAQSFFPYSLVTILQYWEDLTDSQMAQATRSRLDLKYALHLPLHTPGVERITLCAFRQGILISEVARRLLEGLLNRLNEFAAPGKSSGDVERVLHAICLRSRAEFILENMALALEAVAAQEPGWLRANALPHWFMQYHRQSQPRIPYAPAQILKLIHTVGEDGRHLLQAIEKSDRTTLARLPEVQMLRREWRCQFEQEKESLRFRESNCLLCSTDLKFINPRSSRSEGGIFHGV